MTSLTSLLSDPPPERFLRMKDVCDRVGLSKSEIYRRVQSGAFPKQRRRSHKVAIWLESEVLEWMKGEA